MNDLLLSKIQPQNIDMEESVLSSLFINGKHLNDIEELIPEDFYKGAHKKIFQAMLNINKAKEPIDLLTVSSELSKQKELEAVGGLAYLSCIADEAPLAINIRAYAKRIMELSKARELIVIASGIIEEGFNVKDIEQYISDSQSKILNIQTAVSKDKFYTMEDLMENAIENIKQAQTAEFKLGLSFGMPKLDKYMQVWGSKLILLAGRPGMGKSSLAFSIALRVGYSGDMVGILPIEMDKEQFADKTLSKESDINSMIFYARKSLSDKNIETLEHASKRLSDLPIIVNDSSANIDDVKRRCRKFKKMGCKIIIIDQLNQISYEKGTLPYIGISKNCSELKQLTKELRLPILLLCQLNRSLESRDNKRPTKADLAETGRLEQDADMIMFLFREGYYKKNKRDFIDPSITEIELAKNRQGETAVEYQVVFNKKRGMFILL